MSKDERESEHTPESVAPKRERCYKVPTALHPHALSISRLRRRREKDVRELRVCRMEKKKRILYISIPTYLSEVSTEPIQ